MGSWNWFSNSGLRWINSHSSFVWLHTYCLFSGGQHLGIYKLVSSSVLGGELIPTVVSYVYKVVIYVLGERLLVNMGPWKLIYIAVLRWIKTHSCGSLYVWRELTHTVVPCTHTVVVCVMKGWRGKPLITMVRLKLFSSTHLVVTGELTHTVVPYAHTLVVCILKGGPQINMEPLKLFSSNFLSGIDPHTGSVYPHSGCLCYEGVEGETPDNHGALKIIFQWSSICQRGFDPHSC